MKSYLIGAIAAVALLSGTANAANITINATPQELDNPILHSVFHEASSMGGQVGSIVAWFDLDTTLAAGNFWNPVTGAFSININIFPDNSLTGAVGTAVGTGNLAAAAFNGLDGGLIGSIYWDFDAAAEAYSTKLADTTIYFHDYSYITSASGYNFNSTVGTYDSMALWGANGDLVDPIDWPDFPGWFDTNTTTLGVDLVVTFVPVPAAVWLFGSGLIGLVGVARRRKQQA